MYLGDYSILHEQTSYIWFYGAQLEFSTPQDDRVMVCYVYDPDLPHTITTQIRAVIS